MLAQRIRQGAYVRSADLQDALLDGRQSTRANLVWSSRVAGQLLGKLKSIDNRLPNTGKTAAVSFLVCIAMEQGGNEGGVAII